MSRVMLALGSFTIGFCCMLFTNPESHTPAFGQALVRVPNAVPVVPVVPVIEEKQSTYGPTATVPLDGIFASQDLFNGVTFEYGGGVYSLRDSTFSPPIKLSLTGAAANTYALLMQFGQIGCPAEAPRTPAPKAPIIVEAKLTKNFSPNVIVSPFGQSAKASSD
jgi:hypothetical protein